MATRTAEHWMGSVVFDIAAPTADALDPVRALVRDRFDSAIVPRLQAALDRIDDPAFPVRLRRLEIDLGRLGSPTAAPEEILRRMGAGLAGALGDVRRSAPAGRGGDVAASPQRSDDGEALVAFLDKGVLPWTEPGRALAALAAAALALDAAGIARLARRLRPILAGRRSAERLARQLPAVLARRLIEGLAGEAAGEAVAAAFGRAADAQAGAPVGEPEVPRLAEAIRRLARSADGVGPAPADPPRRGRPGARAGRAGPQSGPAKGAAAGRETALAPPQAGSEEVRNEPEGFAEAGPLPVHAAGAVLLHPFLGMLFDRLGLLEAPGRFRDSAARIRAVLLTHHLSTAAEEAPEPELLLAKLLCGMDFAEPVPLRIAPTAAEREQCEALLASVIAQWAKLGRTSPAGLREAFLMRPGRLERREEPWQLAVERRGIDVLLDALPWTLSRVNTPFMPALLRVDWR